MGCCSPVHNILTGVFGSGDPAPVPPVPMTIWQSQSFDLTEIATGYIGGQIEFGFNDARTLSDQLQVDFEYSGTSYIGTPYTFWIALPTGEMPPNNWEWNPTFNSDPDRRDQVEWTEMSSFSQLYCFEKNFTVADASLWIPHYFSSSLGNSELTTQTPYDQPTVEDNIEVFLIASYGTHATATVNVTGNDVSIFFSGIPINTLSLVNWDGVTDEEQSLDLIACP